MPDSLPPASPGAAHREKLRTIIAARDEEQHRLTGLTEARDRAQLELFEARRLQSEHTQTLQQARRDDPIDAAYRYARGDLIGLNHRHTVEKAQATVEKAEANVTRLTEILAALDGEIPRAESRLNRHRHALYEALAEVLVTSPEFLALYGELGRTWDHLRSIRLAFDAIERELHGYMPTKWHSVFMSQEPLDRRVGYNVEEELIERWTNALTRLTEDPEVQLPSY